MKKIRAGLNERKIFWGLLIIAAISIAWAAYLHSTKDEAHWSEWFGGVLQNFSTEMIGAAITFLLFDQILGVKREEEKKEQEITEIRKRLFSEIKWATNQIALNAVIQIRVNQWHRDGIFQGVDLGEAKLQNAVLNQFDLSAVGLWDANLEAV